VSVPRSGGAHWSPFPPAAACRTQSLGPAHSDEAAGDSLRLPTGSMMKPVAAWASSSTRAVPGLSTPFHMA
ncbi:hypothetical protein LEMLEM_LOCUS10972, partial [Lemmus lemmus]